MSLREVISRWRIWEPEETVGHVWDRISQHYEDAPNYPEAAVRLADMKPVLGVLFRGLGGDHGVEIRVAPPSTGTHRRTLRDRIARFQASVTLASFDGSMLLLPEVADAWPDANLNRKLYLWLSAFAVSAGPETDVPPDPLQADVVRLVRAVRDGDAATRRFPGLRPIREAIFAATLAARPPFFGSPIEVEIETWIRARLAGDGAPSSGAALSRALDGDADALASLKAPRDYHSYRHVLPWAERRPFSASGRTRRRAGTEEPGSGADGDEGKRRRARTRPADQAERRDSLILHRFESIFSMIDFINLNRPTEDDDAEGARKAMDDADTISVVDSSKKPKTKLKFDLDLAPEDATREQFSAIHVYPEWDWRQKCLEPARVRVLEHPGAEAVDIIMRDPDAHRRIEAVRRQFDALRPRRRVRPRQAEGSELDLDEVVRSLADRRASGHGSDRLYRAVLNDERDLGVAVLLDASRSTESRVHGRSVIAIEREALEALVRGLVASGDSVGLYAFSSLRRDRVFVDVLKSFDERLGPQVDRRIAGVKPGFYTRLGAAIRHTAFRLSERPNAKKLLLIITDGKPNDIDHYEGRFGVEDTRHAVQEARRSGQSVFAITIDGEARAYLPYLFGRAGFSVVPSPERLVEALPSIYRQIVA